jgi:hypothetical protein
MRYASLIQVREALDQGTVAVWPGSFHSICTQIPIQYFCLSLPVSSPSHKEAFSISSTSFDGCASLGGHSLIARHPLKMVAHLVPLKGDVGDGAHSSERDGGQHRGDERYEMANLNRKGEHKYHHSSISRSTINSILCIRTNTCPKSKTK